MNIPSVVRYSDIWIVKKSRWFNINWVKGLDIIKKVVLVRLRISLRIGRMYENCNFYLLMIFLYVCIYVQYKYHKSKF